MDQEKPFKTIEVLDSKTNQICKVACMSCIRGHRTTSCGIPVCRTKIFWTVKRPGRPSNSCTCRYGATGGCKCVVARSACPHKSKKGEKRSGECRCDEQGRYCCLLEPNHWTALFSLQKPTVEFFSTREALEAKQAVNISRQQFSQIPLHSIPTPSDFSSLPSTPGPHLTPAPYPGFSPQSISLTPRFGLMGIGAPQGPEDDVGLDVLTWDNNVPIAPRELPPPYVDAQSTRGSCCQASTPSISRIASPGAGPEPAFIQQQSASHEMSLSSAYNVTNEDRNPPTTIAPSALSTTHATTFDFERLQADYYHYQFPSAICQNCGLSGCTCKNCPPPFQNPGTGSWAQCCGRKHARESTPGVAPNKVARSSNYDGTRGIHLHAQTQQSQIGGCCGSYGEDEPKDEHAPPLLDYGTINGIDDVIPADFHAFTLDHEFVMPDGSPPLDIADYLTVDLTTAPLDYGSGGRNGGDDQGGGIEGGGGGGGGGGGCCCRGPS